MTMSSVTYSPAARDFKPQIAERVPVIKSTPSGDYWMTKEGRKFVVIYFRAIDFKGNFLGTYPNTAEPTFDQPKLKRFPPLRPVTEEDFKALVKQWRDETWFHSSLSKKYMHPAYQAIIGLGKEGLPFVLRELNQGKNYWFYALRLMARENAAEGIADFEDARAAWLTWGYRNNYL
jgi:hypothetical protein